MDDLLRWRSEFPILDRTTYLISNSLGAMPRGVYDLMREYADTWATRGVRAWEEVWWNLAAQVGDRIGALLGAARGTVSLHQNVSITEAVIASCFDFSGPRNKVVMVDMEFPSILYFWQEQQRRGARVEIIRSEDGIRISTEKLLAAIDEQTLLVPISLVLFRSAAIIDARAVIERAEKFGARVILDTYQAAGTLPVDLTVLGAHFAVGGVLKWLCGGPGVAYLYVRPDLQSLRPAMTGWLAHKLPFEFRVEPMDYCEDAYRFMNGTPQIPALYACQPGLEIVGRAGVEHIRAKSLRLTERLITGALAHGWQVNTPREALERAGTVSIECQHALEVLQELLRRGVIVDYRPKAGIRLSPHFYNREEEVDRAIADIEDILQTGTWKRTEKAVV